MDTRVRRLLKAFESKASIGLDIVLQNVLRNDEPERYGCSDPHVVVGAYVRDVLLEKPVSVLDESLAWKAVEALEDLE